MYRSLVARIRPALLVVALVSLLAGGNGYSPVHAASQTLPRGGTLHTAFDSDFSTLDPAIGYDPFAWTGEHAIFEGLLDYSGRVGSAGTKLVPRLAAGLPERFKQRTSLYIYAPARRPFPSARQSRSHCRATCATPSSARSRRIHAERGHERQSFLVRPSRHGCVLEQEGRSHISGITVNPASTA
jgi:hypothetical protein